MSKSNKNDPGKPIPTVDSIFAEGVEGLSRFIAYANEQLDRDPGNEGLASNLATTLTKLASVQAEQRKAAAEERKRLNSVTPAMVLTWFRTIGPDERRQLVREIQSLDARGSGLA